MHKHQQRFPFSKGGHQQCRLSGRLRKAAIANIFSCSNISNYTDPNRPYDLEILSSTKDATVTNLVSKLQKKLWVTRFLRKAFLADWCRLSAVQRCGLLKTWTETYVLQQSLYQKLIVTISVLLLSFIIYHSYICAGSICWTGVFCLWSFCPCAVSFRSKVLP